MPSANCTVSSLLWNSVSFWKFSHKSVPENEIELAFTLHSPSVTFLTATCFLSLSNCKTALGANSMSLKDLISGYVWLYSFRKTSALHFRRHQLKVCVLLCSWTCSSIFCVITVSTVQLQTVQFVQYLYSKCAVLLCSWTCNSSFCVINVSTVQL